MFHRGNQRIIFKAKFNSQVSRLFGANSIGVDSWGRSFARMVYDRGYWDG